MKILMILSVALLAMAVLYLLMIMPRMLGRPDTAPFREWLYAHRGLHCNPPAEKGKKADDGKEGEMNGGGSVLPEGELQLSDAAEQIAPENSLRAFQKAVDAGYGIELDVQMTKDHIPVVFHDFTLMRMCGGEGKVSDYTYEELQRFSLCGSDQKIPKFEDVLKCVDGKVPLIVELKIEVSDLSVCRAADGLLAEYKGLYCIESFNPLGLLWYRRHRRKVVRGQLAEAFLREKGFSGPHYFLLQNLIFNWLTKPDFIAYNHRHYDMLSRRLCRNLFRNMAVAWTVKSEEQLEEARKHFDLIIFDSFHPSC